MRRAGCNGSRRAAWQAYWLVPDVVCGGLSCALGPRQQNTQSAHVSAIVLVALDLVTCGWSCGQGVSFVIPVL
jgi:hypothetical protein